MAVIVQAHVWKTSAHYYCPEAEAYEIERKGFYVPQRDVSWPMQEYVQREYDPAAAEEWAKKFLDNCLAKKPGRRDGSWSTHYIGEHRWFPGWFSHGTFSKFDSDAEAFADFEEWLIGLGFYLSYGSYSDERDHNDRVAKKLGMSLMAAEDRWRWRRCDCEACQKPSDRYFIAH